MDGYQSVIESKIRVIECRGGLGPWLVKASIILDILVTPKCFTNILLLIEFIREADTKLGFQS